MAKHYKELIVAEIVNRMRAPPGSAGLAQPIRHIPLSYDNTNSEASALRLVLTLFPDWEHAAGHIEFERFTDGITNTVGLLFFTPQSSILALRGSTAHCWQCSSSKPSSRGLAPVRYRLTTRRYCCERMERAQTS